MPSRGIERCPNASGPGWHRGVQAYGRSGPYAAHPQQVWRIHLWAFSAPPARVYVAGMPVGGTDYRPRDAEHAVLYRVIEEHLEAFLETAQRQARSVSEK